MASKAGTGMSHKTDRKARGRSTIVPGGNLQSTKPNMPDAVRAQATRPVTSGVSHRGDRRDTSKAYTGNARHPARGNTPRIDVKTRKR